MVKPGGTGRPSEAISARLAPLPPSRLRIAPVPSVDSGPNAYTHFAITNSLKDSNVSAPLSEPHSKHYPARAMEQKVDSKQSAEDIDAVPRPMHHDHEAEQKCNQ